MQRRELAGRTMLRGVLAAALLPSAAALATADDASAQARVVQINGAKRTGMVDVAIGKSEDIRTDASFVDVSVGDPDIADVNPLTDRSLSILGKKSGPTPRTAAGEGTYAG